MNQKDGFSAKQRALQMIDGLPDDATLEDIMYSLYVIESVEAGLQDIQAGRTIPRDEVRRSLDKWLQSYDETRDA